MKDNEMSFEEALMAFEEGREVRDGAELKVGEKVTGTIVSIGRDYAFVELGTKAEGQVPVAELRDDEGAMLYAVGDSLEALITSAGADSGYSLRVKLGEGPIDGDELRDAQRHGLPVEGRVTAINKGGAEVEVGGVRAFCPVSQLADRFVEDPNEFLEQRLRFLVTRFEEGGPGRQPNVVLSRRAILEEENRQLAEETRAKLKAGARMTGVVRTIKPYGAFVDLGGIEGLLHVSQMSYSRVEDPGEMVVVGQRLDVEILEIKADPKGDGERISLSMRSLQRDPWSDVEQRFPIGSTVHGKVVRVEAFGAFVELAPGLDGLVHVSELGSAQRVNHARDVVSVGQEVEVRVVSLDLEKRRIGLSIGAVAAAATAREESAEKAAFDRRGREQSGGFGSMGNALSSALDRSDES